MKDLIYRPACHARGHFLPWLNALRNRSGVYIIRQPAGLLRGVRCLYVGESHTGNLAKTIKRHFHRWRDDATRKHFTYDRHRVEIAVRVMPPGAAVSAQNHLIARLDPRDNTNGRPEQPF